MLRAQRRSEERGRCKQHRLERTPLHAQKNLVYFGWVPLALVELEFADISGNVRDLYGKLFQLAGKNDLQDGRHARVSRGF